ncbi:hypothetical protein F511_41827 [Dorcoceras hygrometricum]|uniref:Uncharacterized protein n=1 Tax=Dorcoceras hygrometricum TaxID=472368 RepID=A0A2Z7BFP5_9LAMI|nr:hypothetical protein F511_41827 [Dorcoceras hygrometricum]
MSTMQKFKLLATQCAVAASPTRSPASSPVIHLRRRKTLRMLLGRAGGIGGRRRLHRGEMSSPGSEGSSDEGSSPEEGAAELSVRQKLKDLFVSSPPGFGGRVPENMRDGFTQSDGGGGGGSGDGVRLHVARMLRPITATFRQRLLRRAWRPVLVAIPE